MQIRSRSIWQTVLFSAFFLSGFSGLIYESVWSNYLKFFLGHAAYAQTLVLGMYMGGMAAGSWLAARYMQRVRNPLQMYAAVELVIGLFGLAFHSIFIACSDLLLDQVLPGIGSPWLVELLRWGFAAALIVPQTLLLGSTFPLISAGILRAFPQMPGHSISMLYFTNSIGAVLGVMLSGFVLIAAVGLPGTILTASLLNILLALVVYFVDKKKLSTPANQTPATRAAAKTPQLAMPHPLQRPLLVLALITGLSSFIYEISWIRMLSMVLGASTHAFEFMLSAFILGLALGGLWLRKRIDGFDNPLRALAVIQLLMGLLALVSVLAYNSSFIWMTMVLPALQRNEGGYVLFNMTSHVIALLLMLPVTFMAGMTLPLISATLFRQGSDESAIGKVYAFNTLGAIIGVVLAAMLLLPLLGLKMAMITGAALDLGLALWLLHRISEPRRWQLAGATLVVATLAGTMLAPPFNSLWMASTVFRNGLLLKPSQGSVTLHRDGRTATVDVVRLGVSTLVLTTNGKVDASAEMNPALPPSSDEPTMVLLGGLPLLAKPDAKTAAVIGMGAGMSANVMLASKQLQHLDVIEIEGAMTEGARQFGKLSERVFTDPRSEIHIDDAKSYFAVHKKRYDLIVSEPSDSWVSGVSSLFTDEFYGRINHHLTEDGLLVQWLHVYELSPDLVASIFLALGNHFEDYRIYASNNANLVILAKAKGKVPALSEAGFANPELRAAFARTGWYKLDDVVMHEVGDRALLGPLFQRSRAPVNSDFFPYIDQHAVKTRFMRSGVGELALLHNIGLPLPGARYENQLDITLDGPEPTFDVRENARHGRTLGKFFANGASGNIPFSNRNLHDVAAILQTRPACNDLLAQAIWNEKLIALANVTIPNMRAAETRPMLDYLKTRLCDSDAARRNHNFLHMMQALSERDMPATESAAKIILSEPGVAGSLRAQYALNALLLADFQQSKWQEARGLLERPGATPFMFEKIIRAQVEIKLMQAAAAAAR